jgi:hypothetical protein
MPTAEDAVVAEICLMTQVTPAQLLNTNLEPFQTGHAYLRRLHGDPRFRRGASAPAARFRGALIRPSIATASFDIRPIAGDSSTALSANAESLT